MRSRSRSSLLAIAGATALALLLTACGADDTTDAADPAGTDDTTVADDSAADGHVTADDGAADDGATGDDAATATGGDELGLVRVGVSPVPHGDILAFVRDELAEDVGLEIEIVEFTDYVLPNVALQEGDLDANYFQHLPYLTQQLEDNPEYDLAPLGGVHLEPLALYSLTIGELEDLPEGAEVAVPNDPANLGRALWLLEDAGLLTIADTGDAMPSEQDIEDDPRGLVFRPVEAAALPTVLPDVDAAVINGNYALEAGLSPSLDGLTIESAEDNPYANLLVVRAGEEGDERLVALDELLGSDEVEEFIASTYDDGTVIPAS